MGQGLSPLQPDPEPGTLTDVVCRYGPAVNIKNEEMGAAAGSREKESGMEEGAGAVSMRPGETAR